MPLRATEFGGSVCAVSSHCLLHRVTVPHIPPLVGISVCSTCEAQRKASSQNVFLGVSWGFGLVWFGFSFLRQAGLGLLTVLLPQLLGA